MVNKYCDGCPFKKVYFVGTSDNPRFIERCFWALKLSVEVQPEECYVFKIGKIVISKFSEVKNG